MSRVVGAIRFTLTRTGPAGARGMLPYPAGEYDATVTYTATDNVAPYVLFTDGTYYVMNKVGTWTGTTAGKTPAEDYAANGSSATWIPFEAFKAMFVEIFMAKFAKLSAAVFYEEFMFSQYGVNASGVATSDYSGFANGTFTPNILLNFLLGSAAFGAGKTLFNADGTGQLADGNIWWDKAGFIYSKSQLVQVYRVMGEEMGDMTGNYNVDLTLGANIDVNAYYLDERMLIIPDGSVTDQILSIRCSMPARTSGSFKMKGNFYTISNYAATYYSYAQMAITGKVSMYWTGTAWSVDLEDVYSDSDFTGKIRLTN